MLYNKDWDYGDNPVSAVLLKAADLLEKHGHTRFIRKDDSGSMCFLGALEEAQGHEQGWFSLGDDSALTFKASKAVSETMGLDALGFKADPHDARSAVVRWNNDLKRTGQEVIDAMRLTAKVVAKTKVAA